MTVVESVPALPRHDRYRLRAALGAIDDPELIDAVIEMFLDAAAAAASGEVDICVLSARRLPCLYLALLDEGLPPIPCEVVSDRVVDILPPEHWRARQVLVLDDSVILGTTLTHLRDALAPLVNPDPEHEEGSIRVESVCVDTEQRHPELLEEMSLTARRERSSRAVSRFSVQVAQTLFRNQMPYFSDFPISRSIALTPLAMDRLVQMPGWAVADVTSTMLAGPAQFCYSFLPRDTALERALGRLPGELAASVTVAKIRAFGSMKDRRTDLVLVPVAVLGPCTEQFLDEMLEMVADGLDHEHLLDWRNWGADSKHRLLQMYVSVSVLLAFWEDAFAEGVVGEALTANAVRADVAQIHFGAERAPIVLAAFADSIQALSETKPSHVHDAGSKVHAVSDSLDVEVRARLDQLSELFKVGHRLDRVPAQGEIVQPGETFVRPIASVFGFLNRSEMDERSRIRELTAREYRLRYQTKDDRRLRKGVSMPDLANAIGSPESERVMAVSLAIDVCNDLGIAVPQTQTRDGVTKRQYRLGENAFLADELYQRLAEVVRDQGAGASTESPQIVGLVRRLIEERSARIMPRFDTTYSAIDEPYAADGYEAWSAEEWLTATRILVREAEVVGEYPSADPLDG